MHAGGRPTKVTQIVGRTEDGHPITAGQKIVELTRSTWMPWVYCAASVGVSHETLKLWRKEGGIARGKLARGEKVTPNQREYAKFLTELEKAEAEAIAARLDNIHRAGVGGWVKTKTVTTVDHEGNESTTVTTETMPPVWTAEAWELERRRPKWFGRRVEVMDAEGVEAISKEERADALADALESIVDSEVKAFQAGSDAQRERDGEQVTDGG